MWKFYTIVDNKGLLRAKFFTDRDTAEEYQEENYYQCTGDIVPVPEPPGEVN